MVEASVAAVYLLASYPGSQLTQGWKKEGGKESPVSKALA